VPAALAERERLVAECGAGLRSMFHALWYAAESTWLSLDLTITQLKGLMVLRWRGSQSVGELAAALGASEPSASQLVDRLVQRDLVRRDTDAADRRRTLVSITEEGERLLAGLRSSRDQMVEEWLAKLGEDELRALAAGLAAVSAAAGTSSGASCAAAAAALEVPA